MFRKTFEAVAWNRTCHRLELPFLHFLVRPLRRNQAHALHPLDRFQHIYAPGHSPPALSRRFQKIPARLPHRRFAGRNIAGQFTRRRLKPKQLQPIFHPHKRYKLTGPRITLGRPCAPYAEQTPRVKTNNQNASFWPHHPINFAQDFMRIISKFQHMRQHAKINRLLIKGQFGELREQVGGLRFRKAQVWRTGWRRNHPMRDPRFAQQIKLRQP